MNEKERITDLLYSNLYLNLAKNAEGSVIDDTFQMIDVALMYRKLFDLLSSEYYQGKVESLNQFVLVMTKSNEESIDILSEKNFDGNFVGNGKHATDNLIELGIKGKLSLNNSIDCDYISNLAQVSILSTKYSKLRFTYIEGDAIFVLVDGRIIHQISSILSLDETRDFSLKIPASDVKTIISRYVQYFENETFQDKFWKSKKAGHLRDSPEILFSDDLYLFMRDRIKAGRVDHESYIKNTSDRTDVRVITSPNENVFIYEVKWIGKTSGSSNYNKNGAHDRANEGIVQLTKYLTEKKCKQGILIIYDGRLEVEEIKWMNESSWDVRINKPTTILELRKESASKEAEKIIKQNKAEIKKA
ncbi:hypothetical protein AAEO57_09825 [Flavobacterium sp. DGU38]|uniref:Uncharacterized protein n=1 Tax=Flavobacterium calami TaxID=3139144 RepID=A0ABU9INQ5_9FLAO